MHDRLIINIFDAFEREICKIRYHAQGSAEQLRIFAELLTENVHIKEDIARRSFGAAEVTAAEFA